MPPRVRKAGAASLAERLSRFADNPDEDQELATVAKEAYEQAKDSYKFDKSAPSTIKRRNRYLLEYTNYITGLVKQVEKTDVDEERLWGKANIEANVRAYIRFAAKSVAPRAYASESIKFNTLLQRRQALIFWINRKCADDVSRKDIWNATQEALYHAYRAENKATIADEKIYLTKLAMINLLEHDQYTSYNAENAQQQHVAWLLSYLCGVRPGTIGAARFYPDQCLQWKDINIKRVGKGNFSLKIMFRFLKGYRNENMKPLRFTIAAPAFAEDVAYSLGHRLLALAIRRGYLADYETLHNLLEDDKINIAFKAAALNRPVVCASSPKGLEVSETVPASSNAISQYMQRAALSFGLAPGITLYAWRRSAGTNVASSTGSMDVARGMLGHEMQTRTFETSYEQGTVALDVMSIAMGRKQASVEELVDDVIINRVEIATTNKEAWIKNYVESDSDYKEASTAEQDARLVAEDNPDDVHAEAALEKAMVELRNIRRTLKAQGVLGFQRYQLEQTASNMTFDEIERRSKQAKQPGQLQKVLMAAANEGRKNAEKSGKQLRTAADQARADVDGVEESLEDDYDPQDLADARKNASKATTAGDLDEDDASIVAVSGFDVRGRVDAEDLVPLAEDAAVDAAGETLMDYLINDGGKFTGLLTCRLCEEDETVPENGVGEDAAEAAEDEIVEAGPSTTTTTSKGKGKKKVPTSSEPRGNYKTKLWKAGKLKQHLGQEFHSPKAQFCRKYKASHNKCPFEESCTFVGTGSALLQHIFEKTSQTDAHLLAAARAGLFARDFDPKLVRASMVKTASKQADGKVAYNVASDPTDVPVDDLVHPRNLTAHGELEITKASKAKSKAVFRLPTNDRLTDTSLWLGHEEGVYGAMADVLQQQRKYIADSVDGALRQHGVKADETGGTTARKFHGTARVKGIAHLRKRLEDLNFAWAEGIDDAGPAEDDEDEEIGGDDADE